MEPVGLLDDNPIKVGKRIQGFPILGKFDQLPQLIDKYEIEGVLISFNCNGSPNALQEAIRVCRENELFLKMFSIHLNDVDLEQQKISLVSSKIERVGFKKS